MAYSITLDQLELVLIYVKDYVENNAGTTIGWNYVNDKPETFPPSSHTHDDRYYTESEVDTLLGGKSDTGHTHDNRYYTESEVDALLGGKSDTGHTHSQYLTAHNPVDSSLSSTSTNAVQNKVINEALAGKAASNHTHSQYLTAHATVDSSLSSTSTNAVQNKVVQAALAGKAASDHTHSQYLTAHATVDSALSSTSTNAVQNKVINAALAGKAASSHTHDDRYYTESEVNTLLNAKAASNHTHSQYLTAHATVDSALSSTSTNAVQNKVINAALAGKSDTGHTHSQYLTAHATVDSALSSTSTNAVQNKVIYTALAGKAASSHTHSQYLTSHQDISGKANKSGDTFTGHITLSESKSILLRPGNGQYTAGIGYDTRGNECIGIWAKNAVTRLRWHAGVDMTNMSAGTMMGITPDFEISKASGSVVMTVNGGTVKATTFSGNLSGTASAAYYADYAEFFPRGEETEVGDIIALDEFAEDEKYVKATEKSICVIGVHSEDYGMIVGGENPENETASRENYLKHNLSKYIPVSLAGRVPVKFKGVSHKGLKVVPSEIPGVGRAFDATKDDRDSIIGYLVESDNKEDDEIRLLKMKIK